MDEKKAETLAMILGGEAWNSGGGIWLVRVDRAGEGFAVISEDAVCEYESEEAFERSEASKTVLLCDPYDAGKWWVVVDAKGKVYWRDATLRAGWRCEDNAEYEAMVLRSRLPGRFFAVELDDLRDDDDLTPEDLDRDGA